MFVGVGAALLAALFWALSARWYERVGSRIGAVEINALKGLISLVLFIPFLFASSAPWPSGNSAWAFVVSGVIGIAIGDSAWLACLRRIGPRRALNFEFFPPILTGLLALVWLSEALTLINWLGMFVILSSVRFVMAHRLADTQVVENEVGKGLLLGAIAALCQTLGILLSAYGFTQGAGVLEATITRLAPALVVLIPFLSFPQLYRRLKGFTLDHWSSLLMAITLGTTLALWLQLISVNAIGATLSQTMLSLSPLVALLVLRYRGWDVWLATGFATLGVVLVLQ
ncbi:MAG: DMT family transporter [Gammaproteobacteria bacterium]|nr:DMT family transporter [Gammaproteobacteria bacterium]